MQDGQVVRKCVEERYYLLIILFNTWIYIIS